MAAIIIATGSSQPPIHIGEGDPHIHGFYTERYLDDDGTTTVMPGNGQTGFFYDIQCSVDGDGNLVWPEFTIRTTNGLDNLSSRFVGQLYVDGVPGPIIFGYPTGGGWVIPASFGASTNWSALDVYNQGLIQFIGPATTLSAQAIVDLIRLMSAAAVEELALLGSLSANRLPRASTAQTLIDSQIQDNGTSVTVDCLNSVGFGDVNDNQNGSVIDVNDTTGRANFFAGGDNQAQYAGVAAVCGADQSELYLQGSFGEGYNYGVFIDGVVKLGDGLDENNETKIEIDDVNEWIKLHNLPTSDPTEVNALWKDGAFIKISAG